MKALWKSGAIALLTAGSVLLTAGCALTSKAEALSVRWYTPETVKPHLTSAETDAVATDQASPAIEIGRVSSGINLRERIAYRDAAYEVGYYDDKRWTEKPELYVERALARTLFEERGMRRALAGQGPVLDVEVLAFEMLRRKSPCARIQLRVVVHDDRDSLLERTISVERQAAKGEDDFDAMVHAMAQALDAATDQVANDIAMVVAKRRGPVAPPR